EDAVMAGIIRPALAEMMRQGAPFRGILYAGLMVTNEGAKLIEFNVRFGDPECQVLMLRLMSDLLPALQAACDGELSHFHLRLHEDTAATGVVMAARGYPDAPVRGTRIQGLEQASAVPAVQIFHSGTQATPDGAIIAAGGRVLTICATGGTLRAARDSAYAAIKEINWPEGFCRPDIGWRALG
ncbi:MAG: phosphoribosylamine--glycine ligase, partial [Acetobacteraceae bacterium]|nr:phosphoribosylamine--glycine ligase [Acetobacteraceae bacterium]